MPRLPSSYPPPRYGGPPPPPPPPPEPDPWALEGRSDLVNLLTPKSVVSLAVWVMMFGLGAGLAGLILFVIYQGQVNNLRSDLIDSQEELRRTLEQRIQEGGGAPLPEQSLNVSGSLSSEEQIGQLVQNAAPAIVGVTGVDGSGRRVSGSGVVVNATAHENWVLTSYRLVAGTRSPDQPVVRHGNSDLIAELYETDPARNLALIVYRVPADRSMRFSRIDEPEPGDRVWVVGNSRTRPFASGVEATISSATPTSMGLEAELPVGFVGGAVLDDDGRVLGIVTTENSAAPIRQACHRVLRCPGIRGEFVDPEPQEAESGAEDASGDPGPAAGNGQPEDPAEPGRDDAENPADSLPEPLPIPGQGELPQ